MGSREVIIFLGEASVQGNYILHLHVVASITVTFGHFQGGRPIAIPPGDYLYIGSALGQRGATSLAGRLLRHTTRSSNLPAHAIRIPLSAQLREIGLIEHNNKKHPRPKRCFWHIDYLVDQLEAEIIQIIALRTTHRLEAWIARRLAAEPGVSVVAPGLGASDDRNATHLLRIDVPATWWEELPARMTDLINEQAK